MAPRKDGKPKKKAERHPRGKKYVTADFREIGEYMGISHVRAMQIHKRAIRKILAAIKAEADKAGLSVQDWLFTDHPH